MRADADERVVDRRQIGLWGSDLCFSIIVKKALCRCRGGRPTSDGGAPSITSLSIQLPAMR
jgi:hypothetical protein